MKYNNTLYKQEEDDSKISLFSSNESRDTNNQGFKVVNRQNSRIITDKHNTDKNMHVHQKRFSSALSSQAHFRGVNLGSKRLLDSEIESKSHKNKKNLLNRGKQRTYNDDSMSCTTNIKQIKKLMKEFSVPNTLDREVQSQLQGDSILAFDKSSDFVANLPSSTVTTILNGNNNEIRIKKKIWVKEEDDIIMKWTKKHGAKKWRKVASLIPGRNAKQCRERWHNHLDPQISHHEWNEQEEWIQFLCHELHGPKWATILPYLNGRTDNSIKNRWNSHLKKNIHALNKKLKDLKASLINSPNKKWDLSEANKKLELSLLNQLIEKDNAVFNSIFQYTKESDNTTEKPKMPSASEVFNKINANIKFNNQNMEHFLTRTKSKLPQENMTYKKIESNNSSNEKLVKVETDVTTTFTSNKVSSKKPNGISDLSENFLINNANVVSQTRNFSFGMNQNRNMLFNDQFITPAKDNINTGKGFALTEVKTSQNNNPFLDDKNKMSITENKKNQKDFIKMEEEPLKNKSGLKEFNRSPNPFSSQLSDQNSNKKNSGNDQNTNKVDNIKKVLFNEINKTLSKSVSLNDKKQTLNDSKDLIYMSPVQLPTKKFISSKINTPLQIATKEYAEFATPRARKVNEIEKPAINVIENTPTNIKPHKKSSFNIESLLLNNGKNSTIKEHNPNDIHQSMPNNSPYNPIFTPISLALKNNNSTKHLKDFEVNKLNECIQEQRKKMSNESSDELLGKRDSIQLPSSELENSKYQTKSNSWMHSKICNVKIPANFKRLVYNLIQDTGELNSVLEQLLSNKEINRMIVSKLLRVFKPVSLLYLTSIVANQSKKSGKTIEAEYKDFIDNVQNMKIPTQLISPTVPNLYKDMGINDPNNFLTEKFNYDIFDESSNNPIFNSKVITPVQDKFYNYSGGNNSDKQSSHKDSFNIDVTPKQSINNQTFSPGWYYKFSPKMMQNVDTPTGLHSFGNQSIMFSEKN